MNEYKKTIQNIDLFLRAFSAHNNNFYLEMPPKTRTPKTQEEGAGAAAAVVVPHVEIDTRKKRGDKKTVSITESETETETVLAHSDSDDKSGAASAANTSVPPMTVNEIKTYLSSMTQQMVLMRKNMKPNMELSEDDLYLIQTNFMKFKEEIGAFDKMITNVSIRAHKTISKRHVSELKSATGSSSRKPKNDISEEEKETRRINSSINRPKEVISSLAEYINNRYGDNKDDFFEREITDNCYSPVEIQKLIRDVINEDKETNIAADLHGKPFYTNHGTLAELLEIFRVEIQNHGDPEKVEIRERQKLRRVRGSNEQIQESVVSGLIHKDGTYPEHLPQTAIMSLTPFAFVRS
jgi:hypothetical protein